MKKNNANSAKSNSKKIQQSLNLKVASKVLVKIDKSLGNNLNESFLLKIYLKSFLLNKSLQIGNSLDFNLFNKDNSLTIISAGSNVDSVVDFDSNESFMINEETVIEIKKSVVDINDNVKSITKQMDQVSLHENEESILKNILENKKYYLFKNPEGEKNIYSDSDIVLIGCEEEFTKIEKIIKTQIFRCTPVIPDAFLYRGVLINGPSGIGKSHLINYVYQKCKSEVNFLNIDILEDFIISPNESAEREQNEIKIKNTFKFAKLLAPAVIVFEEIDRIFNKGEEEESTNVNTLSQMPSIELNDTKAKLMFTFIKEMDALKAEDKVLIIATSTNSDRIYTDLRKNGRFDYILTLTPPNQKERKLHFINNAKRFNYTSELSDCLDSSDLFEVLADKSHGFVAGDVVQVFKDALVGGLSKSSLEVSLKNIKPINLKDIILDVPKVLWSDIGGNKEVIKKIRQSIEWPLKNAEAFRRIGISPPNGILLYGPPGCSKTMIAKALATESGLNFFAVKGPELFSKYVGDTEKAVRDIFKKAKMSSPSIIFFDEIDSMANQRGSDSAVSDKVLCQLLNEMDGIEGREKVVIFGATNRPDILDKALIRPGRFDRLIYIPPPDLEAKREIFKINLSKMSVDSDVSIEALVEITPGFSGAEINLACREAGMIALDEDISAMSVKQSHLIKAISQIKPVITKEMIDYFENFAKNVEI